MEQAQSLFDTPVGQMLLTAAVSMVPVVELRGGIPFGAALGLGQWQTLLAAVAGNMLPVPFVVVYIRRLLYWLRRRVPRLRAIADALERKIHLKGQTVLRYQYLGLFILVAIPLPGTGAWTGAMVAAFLDLRLNRSLPAIFLGVLTAGLVMTFVTQTVSYVVGG